jgi:hypothetical protein
VRRFALALLACLLAVNAASAQSFEPDTPHYFDHFDPEQKPWQPGPALNIEEVFKNYQYYEIRFLKQGSEIQVRRYIKNQRDSDGRYRILPDGSLDKILQ